MKSKTNHDIKQYNYFLIYIENKTKGNWFYINTLKEGLNIDGQQ